MTIATTKKEKRGDKTGLLVFILQRLSDGSRWGVRGGGWGEPTYIFFMAFDLLLGQVSPSYEEKPLGGRRRAVVKQRDLMCHSLFYFSDLRRLTDPQARDGDMCTHNNVHLLAFRGVICFHNDAFLVTPHFSHFF